MSDRDRTAQTIARIEAARNLTVGELAVIRALQADHAERLMVIVEQGAEIERLRQEIADLKQASKISIVMDPAPAQGQIVYVPKPADRWPS